MAHFKKDGSLDMRYSSSKMAAASQGSSSPSYGATSSGYESSFHSPTVASTSSDLHCKKDGSLDMRYSSSKQASASNQQQYPSGAAHGSGLSSNADLHHKKDGSLDMRYTSSKQAVGSTSGTQRGVPAKTGIGKESSSDDLHRKKDGSLDMRFTSSKQAMSKQVEDALDKLDLSGKGTSKAAPYDRIPSHVPTTGKGLPDMRTKEAQKWVAEEAARVDDQHMPKWVPRTKDGTVDISKPLGRIFSENRPQADVKSKRKYYWIGRLENEDFICELERVRSEKLDLPPPAPLIRSEPLQRSGRSEYLSDDIPDTAVQLEYASLKFHGDEEKCIIGRGSFGVVLKATLGGEPVAVKKLHLAQLTRKEKDAFRTELRVLAHVGQHENLVALRGYCLQPLCLVMELVELGNLSFLLHYCEDPGVEAKMTDGRIKKCLLSGIANGMLQLHTAEIVHGDLKPQNVLVTAKYCAKVADFGLATLRGKTSSVVASGKLEERDGEMVGGTGGYMAPELLQSAAPPDYPSDVYSFGILFNEVVCEQEPYTDQCANFAGRGPFGAANYAQLGGRPTLGSNQPAAVLDLIKRCWVNDPRSRPTFAQILREIGRESFAIRNSI